MGVETADELGLHAESFVDRIRLAVAFGRAESTGGVKERASLLESLRTNTKQTFTASEEWTRWLSKEEIDP